jgi:hypothetical protein
MVGPVFFHVGAPKTGTTYLQTVLEAAREPLAEQGVLVPGSKVAQQRATRDMLHVGTAEARERRSGAWRAMLADMQAWPGTVVFSNETLVFGPDRRRIARLRSRFEDREVHVVYTARDLVRALPAVWQESLKNRSTATFTDYVATLSGGGRLRVHDAGERMWLAQDVCRAMARWQDVLGADHIHVVTLPPRGAAADTLLRRFGTVIGADLTRFADAPTQPNVSLDAVEASVLRRLNIALAELDPPLSFSAYVTLVKRFLANDTFPDRAARTPLWLTPAQAQWALAESHRVADELSRAGFHLVGDLDDLRPGSPGVPVADGDVDDPPVAAERDVALLALARTLHLVDRRP